MAKKKPSLLDAVKAAPTAVSGSQSWFNKLPEGDAKQQLRDLHAARKAGVLKQSNETIRAKIHEVLGVEVGQAGLGKWFRKANPDG